MTGKQLKGEKIILLLADTQPRELKYDFNALVEIEEPLGGSLEGLTKESVLTSLKTLRLLAWAGILHLGEGLSIEEVGRMIPPGKIVPITTAVFSALARDYGSAEGGKAIEPKNPEKPAAESTGN